MQNLKYSKPSKIILIGASTGGPGHIKKILSSLLKDFKASIVIAQHMGGEFIPGFVQQLNSGCLINVEEAKDNKPLHASTVYVCNKQVSIEERLSGPCFKQNEKGDSAYNPDINYLFSSGARIHPNLRVLGIILTGIGDDGAEGCKKLIDKGGMCVAESELTSVVYGMPMQAKKLNQDIDVLSLDKIINLINTWGA